MLAGGPTLRMTAGANRHPRARVVGLCLTLGLLLVLQPARAQESGIPRTRTLPGIPSPAFPYAHPESVGLSSERLGLLADEVAAWVAEGDPIGAELLVIKDGKAVLHEAFGWSDRENKRPMERGSIFLMMSMSKPLTATAILMLEEEGRLTLKDRLSHYVPTHEDDRITIRHLLTHTSGYVHWGEGDEGPSVFDFDSLREWVRAWAAEDPPEPVGEYEYSDFSSAALGYIVEAVSGMPVEEFIESRILRPLQLDRTYVAFSPDAPWAPDVNVLYRPRGNPPEYQRDWAPTQPLSWSFYPAAFGLLSTALDYARFLALWMNKGEWEGTRLLSDGTVQRALEVQSDSTRDRGYGYGWFVRTTPRANGMPFLFQHGGQAGTKALAFPAANAMVVLLTHTWDTPKTAAPLLNRIGRFEVFDVRGAYDPALELPDTSAVRPVALTPLERQAYVGIYRGASRGADGETALHQVWEADQRLHIRQDWDDGDSRLYHLIPLGDDEFLLGRFRGSRVEAVNPRYVVRFQVHEDHATGFDFVLPNGAAWFSARHLHAGAGS